MKTEICIFTVTTNLNKLLLVYNSIIEKLPNEYESIKIVNFNNLYTKKQRNYENHSPHLKKYTKKVEFYYPKSENDFNNFIKGKKIFAFDGISKDIKNIKLRRLFKNNNIDLILLLNLGSLSNEYYDGTKNVSLFFTTLKKKLTAIIYKILIFFRYHINTYIYFEARKDIYENILKKKNSQTSLFTKFKLINFEHIYLVNSQAHESIKYSNRPNLKKKIIFIDGNYKHGDILKNLEGKTDLYKLKKNYFERLKKTLLLFNEKFHNPIQISLHPTSDISEYKEYFSEFEVIQFKTEELTFNASLVLFHESSAVTKAIMLKKNIISLETEIFGDYIKKRIRWYQKELNLPSVSIDNITELSKEKILKESIESISKYDKYINRNLKSDDEENSSEKIYRIIKEHTLKKI